MEGKNWNLHEYDQQYCVVLILLNFWTTDGGGQLYPDHDSVHEGTNAKHMNEERHGRKFRRTVVISSKKIPAILVEDHEVQSVRSIL